VTPFRFGVDQKTNREEMDRFEAAAKPWKPAGYDSECRLRLEYYLYQQRKDLLATLRVRYPETHAEIEPYLEMLPVTRFFVHEQAKVFLHGAALELADEGGEALTAEDARRKRWEAVQEEMDLALRLKLTDRYATLLRTCFLRLERTDAGMGAQIFLPQNVDAAWDPAFPFDLDRAYGVRLRVAGDPGATSGLLGPDGKSVGNAADRWEFWCAREGDAQYLVIRGDGVVEAVDGNADGVNPFGVVPLVMFAQHTEELGAFTLAGQGLHLFNRAVDVLVTDLHHIAATQGFGQLVVSYKEGFDAPQKIVAGPTRAITLRDGATAEILSPSPQIAALVELVDKDLKRQAVLHGIPPGAVSLEARAVASGISLQIELRPLMEVRKDAIDFYRAPMRRLWRVCQVVHDAAQGLEGPKFGATVRARWQPGEVQLPSDAHLELDDLIVKIANNLMTRAEAIAQLRRLTVEEAKKVLATIQEENGVSRVTPFAGNRADSRFLPGGGSPTDPAAAGSIAAAAKSAVLPPGQQRRGAE
jgi:hypothetical protein